jgi:hypothetical protein
VDTTNTTGFPITISEGGSTRIIMPGGKLPWGYGGRIKKTKKKKEKKTSHSVSDSTFGVVYANEIAVSEFENEKPQFPVGSIIVREKNKTKDAEIPEKFIAMVKREKGFSKKTGDWEFFVFDGKDLQLQKRETVGNCSACHSNVKNTDWVFREYLNKNKESK